MYVVRAGNRVVARVRTAREVLKFKLWHYETNPDTYLDVRYVDAYGYEHEIYDEF